MLHIISYVEVLRKRFCYLLFSLSLVYTSYLRNFVFHLCRWKFPTWISVIVLYDLKIDIPSYPFTGLDRPSGLQEFEALRLSRQSAHESGKVVSPAYSPPVPTRRYPRYSFVLEDDLNPGLRQ